MSKQDRRKGKFRVGQRVRVYYNSGFSGKRRSAVRKIVQFRGDRLAVELDDYVDNFKWWEVESIRPLTKRERGEA